MNSTSPEIITGSDTDIGISTGRPYNVILFNDEHHDMMEVVNQIVKACHCSPPKAVAIMMEAHTAGRAIVITGSLEHCEHVSAILEEIRLETKVEPA